MKHNTQQTVNDPVVLKGFLTQRTRVFIENRPWLTDREIADEFEVEFPEIARSEPFRLQRTLTQLIGVLRSRLNRCKPCVPRVRPIGSILPDDEVF